MHGTCPPFRAMPRPVARSLPPRPVVALPRWLLAAAGTGALLLGASGLLWRLNKTNDRLQSEHRLAADPVLGLWMADMKQEIEAFERGAAPPEGARQRLAEAVWLGRVHSLDYTTKQGEGPRLSDVILAPAHLLAGRRSPMDPRGEDGVRISVLGHTWPRGEPRKGEPWVFAVRRINKGNNVAHAAHPAP